MKYQVLVSLKTMKAYSRMSSAAVLIGTLRVESAENCVYYANLSVMKKSFFRILDMRNWRILYLL